MNRRGTGLLVVGALASLALGGCREIVLDPASRHPAPLVEPLDARVDEDAATPPPEPTPGWALEGAPPPAFPPPD